MVLLMEFKRMDSKLSDRIVDCVIENVKEGKEAVKVLIIWVLSMLFIMLFARISCNGG